MLRRNLSFEKLHLSDSPVWAAPKFFDFRRFFNFSSAAGSRGLFDSQSSQLHHNIQLDVLSSSEEQKRQRSVRLVCTLGPSSNSVETIQQLIRQGMNIARLNFSHGSHEYHLNTIQNVRKAVQGFEQVHVGIAIDTKGPEIRTGTFAAPAVDTPSTPEGKTNLGQNNIKSSIDIAGAAAALSPPIKHRFLSGQEVLLTTDEQYRNAMTPEILFVDYPHLLEPETKAKRVLIADGILELQVVGRVTRRNNYGNGSHGDFLQCVVTSGETFIGSRSNCHLPGVTVDLPAISTKDIADLTFAAHHNADFIFASFTRGAAHVRSIRKMLTARGSRAAIISKIENFEGIKNLEEIVAESDGIMVARGDLGVDLAPERVFLAQKKIISIANICRKPVICATQMLESMTTNPRPTRAEVSDVANAVTDGCDAVMLSAESASGKYPVAATKTLSDIASTAFSYIRHRKRLQDMIAAFPAPTMHQSTAAAAVLLAQQTNAKCIMTLTLSGNSVLALRQYSPECHIVAVCATAERARQLSIVRNVVALHFENMPYEAFDEQMSMAIDFLTPAAKSEDGGNDSGQNGSANKKSAALPGASPVWSSSSSSGLPDNNTVAGHGLVLKKGDTVIVSCTDSSSPEYGSHMSKSKTFETFVKIHIC